MNQESMQIEKKERRKKGDIMTSENVKSKSNLNRQKNKLFSEFMQIDPLPTINE